MGYIHEVTNSSPAQTSTSRPFLQPDAHASEWRKQETGGTVREALSWRKRPLADCRLRNVMKVKMGADKLGCTLPLHSNYYVSFSLLLLLF